VLFRRLCLVTGDPSEAEDVMQDAFLNLWERWDRVRAMEDPTGYLYRTAMNLFRKRYRRALLVARRAVGLAPPRDQYAEVDAKRVVARALATLSPRQRAALVLTELVGYSSAEAGRTLGIKAGTVRALATQAREALRRTMEPNDE
jgi:RNA polymerase sigma factor (sigma-70 family)